MFVLRSTYENERKDRLYFELNYRAEQAKYNNLVDKWNDLVTRINNNGGINPPQKQLGFDKDTINKLLSLCHPDKHGGKKTAEEMTAKLLKLRQRTKHGKHTQTTTAVRSGFYGTGNYD